MGEELLPGLVKVIEERLGPLGRPFTTLMVILAGLGVMAWGCKEIYQAFVTPILDAVGVEPGPDAVEQALAFVGLVGFIAIVLWLAVYASDRIQGRRFSSRLRNQDEEIKRLREQLESRDLEVGGNG